MARDNSLPDSNWSISGGTTFVNPHYGNDATGKAGDPTAAFKTIEAAYAVAPARTEIVCLAAQNINPSVLNSATYLYFNKCMRIIGGVVQNSSHMIKASVEINIDLVDNMNFYLGGHNIARPSSESARPALLISSVEQHEMLLEDLYLICYKNVSGEEIPDPEGIALKTINEWQQHSPPNPVPATLFCRRLRIYGCVEHNAGTVGDPLNRLGYMLLENCTWLIVSYPTVKVRSGYLEIKGPQMPARIEVYGGALELHGSSALKSQLTNINGYTKWIDCKNVASVGISFLFLYNILDTGKYLKGAAVTDDLQIYIGEYVVYDINFYSIDPARIVIHPNAVRWTDYLLSLGRNSQNAWYSNSIRCAGLIMPSTRQGTATLIGGTVTIENTSITANSKIQLTHDAIGGTIGILSSVKTPGTGFIINSSSATDTSTVSYLITESA